MNLKFINKRIVAIVLTGVVLAPTAQVLAAEAASVLGMPQQNKEISFDQNALFSVAAEIKDANLNDAIKIESTDEIRLTNILTGKVFAVVGAEGYFPIKAKANEASEVVGKVYESSIINIVERTATWTKVSSGNVEGFIKTEYLLTGKAAEAKAKELLTAKYPEVDITTLNKEEIEACFSVGETAEEEIARLAAEEAARIAAEQARLAAEKAAAEAARAGKRQALVEYANQFIGNPYVYGGTSLTRGTDCSGFVKGVYAHFGVSLPRTSYSMRSVGYAVSFSDIQPGDIVCYSGHVGIYAGNGKIVNAIDESHGIGMSNVKYSTIITIRRIF